MLLVVPASPTSPSSRAIHPSAEVGIVRSQKSDTSWVRQAARSLVIISSASAPFLDGERTEVLT